MNVQQATTYIRVQSRSAGREFVTKKWIADLKVQGVSVQVVRKLPRHKNELGGIQSNI
jgi:hypothetical protein